MTKQTHTNSKLSYDIQTRYILPYNISTTFIHTSRKAKGDKNYVMCHYREIINQKNEF